MTIVIYMVVEIMNNRPFVHSQFDSKIILI